MKLTLQTISSTMVSDLLCQSDFDGIVLDTEHGCFNNESLYSCIQTTLLNKKLCFVRFTDLNKQLVRMCLDAGVTGVIFSTVETREQCRDIINYCKYPNSNGVRGCGLVRENLWGKLKIGFSNALIIGQIETDKAVENLDDIKDCGFDMFFIGPFDLSNSLGKPGEWDDKTLTSTISYIQANVGSERLGVFAPTKETLKKYGGDFKNVVIGTDFEFIKLGIGKINER